MLDNIMVDHLNLTSSILRLGSGDITVLAEKLTRFPDKLLLNRPCFPFKRW